MEIFHSLSEYQAWRKEIPADESLGFVPTMGALHAGHASLVAASVAENSYTLVSIFVNPTQFGANEDLDKYPKTLEADCRLLEEMGASAVLVPRASEIYPVYPTQIIYQIRDLDKKLCGTSRPGHFNGVVQVLTVLFNLARAHKSYFGQKDFQQLMIIRQMVKEMHIPTEVIGCPIMREEDGLAMSSRNVYLSEAERAESVNLSQILKAIQAEQWVDIAAIKNFVQTKLAELSHTRLDYFEVYEAESLSEIEDLSSAKNPHLFIAAFVGTTRLIDNMPRFE